MNTRVLIADDDQDIREILSVLLAQTGADVVSVTSGRQLHRKLQEESFDLVVTDVRMPGLTGIQVLQMARQAEIATPFLILSSMHVSELESWVTALPATAFLRKPFSAQSLFAVAGALLGALAP